MATPGKFSFSGWSTSSIAPKVPVAPPPATNLPTAAELRANAKAKGFTPMPPPEFRAQIEAMPGGIKAWSEAIMKGIDPGIGTGKPTATWSYDKSGKLVSSAGETFTGAPAATTTGGAAATTTTGGAAATTTTGGLPGSAPQTNAANTNIPAWLQGEVDKINAQDALRNAVLGVGVGGGGGGGGGAPIDYGGILAGSAALTRAQTGKSLYMDQRGLNNQIQELMRRRASMYQGGGAPGLYDLSGAAAMDRRLQYLTGVAAPLGASTLSSFGTRPGSGWTSPGGNISAGFF